MDVIECVVGPCALQLRRWEPPGLAPASTASTASLPSPLHRPSLPSRQSTSRCCSSRTVTPPAARTSHYPKSLACFLKEIFFCLFFCCYSPPTGMMSRSRTAVSASLSKALSHTVVTSGAATRTTAFVFVFRGSCEGFFACVPPSPDLSRGTRGRCTSVFSSGLVLLSIKTNQTHQCTYCILLTVI